MMYTKIKLDFSRLKALVNMEIQINIQTAALF